MMKITKYFFQEEEENLWPKTIQDVWIKNRL